MVRYERNKTFLLSPKYTKLETLEFIDGNRGQIIVYLQIRVY